MWISETSTLILCIIVFLTQIAFVFSRTMNVIYTSEHNENMAMITGAVTHITWLLSVGIGVSSVMYLNWTVMTSSLIGGLIGTKYGIKLKSKINEKNNSSRRSGMR